MNTNCKFILKGAQVTILVADKLSLKVLDADQLEIWATSTEQPPRVELQGGLSMPLYSARRQELFAFRDQNYVGHQIRLSDFPESDVQIELLLAIDAATDELFVQVEQVGGKDVVSQIKHLYRIDKPVSAGGYMVLPHGSGYLIPADCPDELPGSGEKGGFIGGRWTLPMFGMVCRNQGLCIIVQTWWDCGVKVEHKPGQESTLDFQWIGSLGKLAYARRFLVRFAKNMDYVAMAKLYREHAKKDGLLVTLEQKVAQTPAIRRYIDNVLVRWGGWCREEEQDVLADLRKIREMGMGINYFFPKWPEAGYVPDKEPEEIWGTWQMLLQPNPLPEGWRRLVNHAEAVRDMGCLIQGFTNLLIQVPEGLEFDEANWVLGVDGKQVKEQSSYDALGRTRRGLDNIEAKELRLDVLYFDGNSAHRPWQEDYSPLHRVTRRETYGIQNQCFVETRCRGVVPGAELSRFWCIANCDYFFFSDWSSDRLTNVPTRGAPTGVGVPVPLFQLVFHECYIAGFSGGGYSLYTPGYDWWPDRTPRLYEMLFTSAPAHNWLPKGHFPIQDWDSPQAKAHWVWLKRWNAYYKAIATSEMTSHQFLSSDYKRQRIEFANGVWAEFDMDANLCRVKGVSEFTGDWESPAGDIGSYLMVPDLSTEQIG